MSDNVRDRAREILAGVGSPCGDAIGGIGAREAVSLLDAAGIALVDAQVLEQLHERCRELAETLGAERERYDRELERLRDERRRLLAFRDAHDQRFGKFVNYSDFAEHRSAVADIEP